MAETKVDFQKIWRYPRNKRIRKQIEDTRNLSLNALFDISQDFERRGPYNKLRLTRNALTHRIVHVRKAQKTENEENMIEDTLVSRTIQLARIVRSSTIYSLNFVYTEEERKNGKSERNSST